MSRKYLGLPFDIHGGGADLVFPHHENERAQSEAACGCTFARHWMHSGMLQIANEKTGEIEKMSKSLNNFLLLHEALDIVRPETLRMLMLQTHYRSPLVFGDARLAEADAALTRIENTVKNLEWLLASATAEGACALDAAAIEGATQAARAAFVDAMDDDFNAPAALGAVFTLVGDVNSAIAGKEPTAADVPALIAARDSIAELMGVFGIDVAAATAEGDAYPAEVVDLAAELAGYAGGNATEAVEALVALRAEARASKDWARADAVRDGMAALGLTIKDTPQGPQVEMA